MGETGLSLPVLCQSIHRTAQPPQSKALTEAVTGCSKTNCELLNWGPDLRRGLLRNSTTWGKQRSPRLTPPMKHGLAK